MNVGLLLVILFIVIVVSFFVLIFATKPTRPEAEVKVQLALNFPETFRKCLMALDSIKAKIISKDEQRGLIKAKILSPKSFILFGVGGASLIEINLNEVQEDKTLVTISSKPFWSYRYPLGFSPKDENVKIVDQLRKSLS